MELGKPESIIFQTITIASNPQNPSNVFLCRCYRCGYGLSQVQGVITNVIPGGIPSDEVPTWIRCPKCHQPYRFQTHKTAHPTHAHMVLSYNPEWPFFRCMACHTILGRIMANGFLNAEGHRMKLPAMLSCTVCPMSYVIEDVL